MLPYLGCTVFVGAYGSLGHAPMCLECGHRPYRAVSGIGREQMTAANDRFAVQARITPFIILICLRLRIYRSRFITGLFI